MSVIAHDRLLTDLGATFRPQREWAEGPGLYLIAGHFLTGIGAGTWLFALLFDVVPGLVVAIAAVALGGLAHLKFLGRPARFWRMVRARHSWIARGFIGMNVFVAGAVLAALPRIAPGMPWTADGAAGRFFLAVSLVGMAILMVYKGNVYAASRGVPFWNSPVLPVLYIAYALRGGVAVLLVLFPFVATRASADFVALIELWTAVSAAVMVAFYLAVIRGAHVAARRSVAELVRGRLAPPFFLGTVGAGLVVPIVVGLAGLIYPLSLTILALVGALSLVGDFFAKLTIAKAGFYVPVVPAGMSTWYGSASWWRR
ncbi:MAG: polysulfide reductase NrfD [Candidatus Rokubacteria bacterium]|nr:polysulfide reductase NrfD [Candidatus Rokubacteria bacterium]